MRNYLKAVNRKLNSNFIIEDYYSQHVVGKRNDVEPSGPRHYGSWEKLYNEIKANYKPGNILEVTLKEDTQFDETPNIFSETEYYGIYMKYPEITIKTPKTNRVKKVIDGRYI